MSLKYEPLHTVPHVPVVFADARRSRRCSYTLHSTPYTLHPTPYTLHSTPYTLSTSSLGGREALKALLQSLAEEARRLLQGAQIPAEAGSYLRLTDSRI